MNLSKEDQEFVKAYDDSKYAKPSVTADMVIFAGDGKAHVPEHGVSGTAADDGIEEDLSTGYLEVLLIQRGRPPFRGQYALPGGFVNPDESVDDAAARELKEETGVECGCLEQLRTFSTPGRDPRRWVITCAYLALVEKSEIAVQAGDDAKAAEWFAVKLKRNDMETESGHWILELQHRKEHISIPFREEKVPGYMRPKLCLEQSDRKLAFDHDLILAYAVMQMNRSAVS